MNTTRVPPLKCHHQVPVIGVDLAGADSSEEALFKACKEAVDSSFQIRCYLSSPTLSSSEIDTVTCPEVITMDDDPLSAVHNKRSSSLMKAIHDLRSGAISALVTCAHTGAVTAASSIILSRFVRHPALVVELPTSTTPITALDMGAFFDASAEDLILDAYLGAAYAKTALQIAMPRIGLLNIGKEDSRGPPELQAANNHLRTHPSSSFSYVGNIEPVDVFSHAIDVLVTSGFCGNIFLKTAEEVANFGARKANDEKGALLAGVRGIVLKCHGKASPQTVLLAIRQAYAAIKTDLSRSLESFFLATRPSSL